MTQTATKLWMSNAAWGTVPRGEMVKGLEGEVTIPCPWFLVEHPDGIVLWDTGLDFDAYDDPAAVYGAELVEYRAMELTSERRLDRQLALIGKGLSDVTHVIISHAHVDHTGALHKFPEAKFYIGPGELDFVATAEGHLAANIWGPDMQRASAIDWIEVPAAGLDLFGDGAVEIVSTPGHTPGQLSLIVRLRENRFLLTSDMVHLRIGYDTEVPDEVAWSDHESIESIRKVKALAEKEGLEVWIHHDPDDYAAHRTIPDYYG